MNYESFESALEDLKDIVMKFENNKDIAIDELLDNYERGMKAYSFCMNKLDNTQKKIKIIDDSMGDGL